MQCVDLLADIGLLLLLIKVAELKGGKKFNIMECHTYKHLKGDFFGGQGEL